MSADLFAEFGYGLVTAQTANSSQQREVGSQTNSLIPDLETSDDATYFNTSNDLTRPTPQHASVGLQSEQHITVYRTNQLPGSIESSRESNSYVLFDASLGTLSSDEADDDWGEFESPETTLESNQSINPAQRQNKTVSAENRISARANGSGFLPDAIDLLDSLSIQDQVQTTKPQAHLSTRSNHAFAKGNNIGASTNAPVDSFQDSWDDWGDFVDGPSMAAKDGPTESGKRPTGKTTPSSQSKSTPLPTGYGVPKAMGNPKVQESQAQIRPTNIPPPSVLLQLFPQLFEQLKRRVSVAKANAQQKSTLDDVAELTTCTLKAAARVVAGRTLRWKRDSILSRSMKIGPARSGKSGGMKLNTVNKSENAKEQQEAVDVVQMWRDKAALFNSLIMSSGRRPVSVIAENVRVMTAGPDQGALKAPHPCALCGLKRDERLPKVDESVEDSFGEWWTDHWGHTECKRFWEINKHLLGQR